MTPLEEKAYEYASNRYYELTQEKQDDFNHDEVERAYLAGYTEAEERHTKDIAKYNQSLDEAKQREQLSQDMIANQRKQLQGLKDKTVDAFRFAIDLPKESDTYKLLEKLFTQKLIK